MNYKTNLHHVANTPSLMVMTGLEITPTDAMTAFM